MLLDTNALLLPVRSRFPLEAEIRRWRPEAYVAVPSSTLDELTVLVERGVRGARAALSLARRLPLVPADGRGDDAVLAAAVRRKAWVVTADQKLADRLTVLGVSVLVPRDRHRLELRPGEARTGTDRPAPLPHRRSRPRQRL